MKLWIDINLPPGLAKWLPANFRVDACALLDTPMSGATDADVFQTLREPGQVVVTKDEDFVDLVTRFGVPPQVLWIRTGNVSNPIMTALLNATLPSALELLESGVPVVQIVRNQSRIP